jgi:hypothetical protein
MNNLTRISIFYLTLPFILFLFGWFRLFIAIPVSLIIIFTIYQLFKQSPVSNLQSANSPITNDQLPTIAFFLLIITGAMLFFTT